MFNVVTEVNNVLTFTVCAGITTPLLRVIFSREQTTHFVSLSEHKLYIAGISKVRDLDVVESRVTQPARNNVRATWRRRRQATGWYLLQLRLMTANQPRSFPIACHHQFHFAFVFNGLAILCLEQLQCWCHLPSPLNHDQVFDQFSRTFGGLCPTNMCIDRCCHWLLCSNKGSSSSSDQKHLSWQLAVC